MLSSLNLLFVSYHRRCTNPPARLKTAVPQASKLPFRPEVANVHPSFTAKRPRLHLSEDPSRSSTDSVTQESEPRLLYDLPSLCPAPLPLMSSLPIPEPPTVQLDIPMYSDQLPLLAFEVEVAASKLAKSPAKRGPRIKPANDPLARFRKARKGGRVGRLTQMLEGLPLELLTEVTTTFHSLSVRYTTDDLSDATADPFTLNSIHTSSTLSRSPRIPKLSPL